MKKWVSRDPVHLRGLYENGSERILICGVTIEANDPPGIEFNNERTDAGWQRRVVKWPMTCVQKYVGGKDLKGNASVFRDSYFYMLWAAYKYVVEPQGEGLSQLARPEHFPFPYLSCEDAAKKLAGQGVEIVPPPRTMKQFMETRLSLCAKCCGSKCDAARTTSTTSLIEKAAADFLGIPQKNAKDELQQTEFKGKKLWPAKKCKSSIRCFVLEKGNGKNSADSPGNNKFPCVLLDTPFPEPEPVQSSSPSSSSSGGLAARRC